MIQRIQTIFLILGIGLAIAFWFIPFGYAPILDTVTHQSALQAMKGIDFIGLIIPNAVSILLMLITIFTYKNYKIQKLFGILAGLSIVVTIGVVCYAVISPYVGSDPDVTIATVWGGGGLFLVAALIADIAAYNYICKDQRLIRSYDRIR
jgi:hypothetical protein